MKKMMMYPIYLLTIFLASSMLFEVNRNKISIITLIDRIDAIAFSSLFSNKYIYSLLSFLYITQTFKASQSTLSSCASKVDLSKKVTLNTIKEIYKSAMYMERKYSRKLHLI